MRKLITLGLIFGASALSACGGSGCGGHFVQSSVVTPSTCPTTTCQAPVATPSTCPATNPCQANDPNDPNDNQPSTLRSWFGGDRTPTTGANYNDNQQQQSTGLFSNTAAGYNEQQRGYTNSPAGGMMAPEQQNQSQARGFFSNFQSNRANAIQDPQLINRVRQALMNNHNIDARAIQVTSDNGTVTLLGLVRNDAARAEAENTAKNVDGVSSIDNKLTTQPNQNQNSNWNY